MIEDNEEVFVAPLERHGGEEEKVDEDEDDYARIDPSSQSLPMLEARLVYDLPEEPVYDAFPIDSTPENDSRGWSMRA